METIHFEGWDGCVRLANAHAELIISTSFGPRILRYGLLGGLNAFALCPELSIDLGTDAWKPYGGHRLWLAPEALPRSYFPDNGPIGRAAMDGNMLRLTNPPEPTTGIQKEMRVTLAPGSSAVRVVHRLTNHGAWPVTVSAWALSIVANGGFAVLPQEDYASHDDDLLPARPIVVWPFTDMADARWRWGTKYITLRQTDLPADKPQKVGIYNKKGWGAHLTPGQAFVVHIDAASGSPERYADQGCTFETYTDGPFQEMETLSPLTLLEPGQSLEHVEDWFLAPHSGIADTDDALDALLLPIVARAAQARMA